MQVSRNRNEENRDFFLYHRPLDNGAKTTSYFYCTEYFLYPYLFSDFHNIFHLRLIPTLKDKKLLWFKFSISHEII